MDADLNTTTIEAIFTTRLVALENRLRQLENAHRRLQRFFALVVATGIVAVVGLLTPAESTEAQIIINRDFNHIVAQSVSVIGPHGQLTMGSSKSGVGLNLSDRQNRIRAGLFLQPLGPELTLNDERGSPRVRLQLQPGNSALSIEDVTSKQQLVLGLDKQGPVLTMGDSGGVTRLQLAVTPSNGASLHLYDPLGRPRAMLRYSLNTPEMKWFDEKGNVIFQVPN